MLLKELYQNDKFLIITIPTILYFLIVIMTLLYWEDVTDNVVTNHELRILTKKNYPFGQLILSYKTLGYYNEYHLIHPVNILKDERVIIAPFEKHKAYDSSFYIIDVYTRYLEIPKDIVEKVQIYRNNKLISEGDSYIFAVTPQSINYDDVIKSLVESRKCSCNGDPELQIVIKTYRTDGSVSEKTAYTKHFDFWNMVYAFKRLLYQKSADDQFLKDKITIRESLNLDTEQIKQIVITENSDSIFVFFDFENKEYIISKGLNVASVS